VADFSGDLMTAHKGPNTSPRLLLDGIHHLKMPVSNLARSRVWYERVFGFAIEVEFTDQDDGVVRGVAGTMPGLSGTRFALRENADTAERLAGFDPIAFAVRDRATIDQWVAHIEAEGIRHSTVSRATMGWIVSFCDPDGVELRLYSRSLDS
jgi:catechol 2,3-dioxygenase-like lactoylglutathione lyase family enzyme